MNTLSIKGMKDLDDMEVDAVNRLGNRYLERIVRKLGCAVDLTVHIKKYRRQGVWWKCSVHSKVSSAKGNFASTKAVDWEINTALHKSFTDILNQVEHALKPGTKGKHAGSSEAVREAYGAA